jgi:large subunit ribosomal protein L10
MPLTKEDKSELLQEYEQGLAASPHAFLLGYQGIKVPQVTALREKVRQSGGEYLVVKNTIALRAIDGNALGQLKEHFVGPTAVAFGSDPVAIAKALTEFAKDVPVLQFKAGLVEGRAVPAAQIKDIASLPSREELIAKLLFLIQSPVTRFVRVLAALPQSLVVVLDQVRQQKEGPAVSGESGESGEAGESAEPAA